MKDIDWKAVLPVTFAALLIGAVGGAALGTYVLRPALDRAKAKKEAAKGSDKSKKG